MPQFEVRNPKMLANAIRDARRQAGLSVAEVADVVGTTQQYIYEIEAGSAPMWITRVFRILRRLDIRVTVSYGDGTHRG